MKYQNTYIKLVGGELVGYAVCESADEARVVMQVSNTDGVIAIVLGDTPEEVVQKNISNYFPDPMVF